MPGQARHDNDKVFTNSCILSMVVFYSFLACHAGLDPASRTAVENFFKTPYRTLILFYGIGEKHGRMRFKQIVVRGELLQVQRINFRLVRFAQNDNGLVRF